VANGDALEVGYLVKLPTVKIFAEVARELGMRLRETLGLGDPVTIRGSELLCVVA
jgi:hypothetical protein